MEIFGVEACGMEDTYAWEKVSGASAFTRITLTDRQLNNREWKQKLHRQMQSALNEAKPQVVAVPGWSSTDSLSALSWCLRTNTPAVMMSESTEWDERRVPWKEWMKRRLIRICSAALAGGAPHGDYLKKLGLPPERIFSGYDAVDNGYFENKVAEIRNQKSEIRNKYGLPEKYFLASARFVEKKNLPRLLQAFARYRALAQRSEIGDRKSESANQKGACEIGRATSQAGENQNKFQLSDFPISGLKNDLRPPTSDLWHLVLLGDGPLRSSIFDLRSSLGLDNSVHLPGFKQYDELPIYYGLASVFVHASATEQWGLVVNEAMASGLPVLVSNRCGCALDLVQEGKNGFTFDPFNVEQLAQMMLKISAFSFPLSAFGSESHRIISNWGPERFASGLQQAVEMALTTPRRRPTLFERFLLRALVMRRAFEC